MAAAGMGTMATYRWMEPVGYLGPACVLDTATGQRPMEEERSGSGPRRPQRRRKPASVQKPRELREARATHEGAPAPRRAHARRGIHWARHGIEFLVIVAGIMVSFLLNDWRKERQDRREEQQLLSDLRDDLRQDSLSMAKELNEMDALLAWGNRLHTHHVTPVPNDSVSMVLSPVLSYTATPIHQVSYQAMLATRSAALIRDKQLLRDILDQYGSRYFMLREMQAIDKHNVLERLFPITERHVMLTEVDQASLGTLLADKEWRNLSAHTLLFKKQIAEILRKEIAHGDTLMRRIEAQLFH